MGHFLLKDSLIKKKGIMAWNKYFVYFFASLQEKK